MLPTYSPLLTDLYQLTMAYGYWKLGMHDREAVFHLLFRKNPFKGNHAIHCGLASFVAFIEAWNFSPEDIAYLATLKNAQNKQLFTAEFLTYLSNLKFTCDIDAIPEGTIVFAHTPLVRVQGPILQCQLIESAILNMINFQSLIATKSARVCHAAGKDEVIEFGLRRAQGPDGALSASRAAYIGGCSSTSNTLAGKMYGIPVKGTHAHSWVTAFENELEAFSAYAEVMPHNCVLLVDTYNTLQGVKNAIQIGKRLREQGADLLGVRLDSGDMADLSIKARKLLDDSGFETTTIIASNSLDEYVVSDLKAQHALINAWGVGTNLATAYDQPALDGVYKLAAIKDKHGNWVPKLKLSEQEIKVSNPGRHQVRRFFSNEQYFMDVIYDIDMGIPESPEAMTLDPPLLHKHLNDYDAFVDLLEPIFKQGKYVQQRQSIHEIRQWACGEAERFYATHGEAVYPVGLEKNLHSLKQALMEKVKA